MATNSAAIPFLKPLSDTQAATVLLDSQENIIGRDPSCKVVLDSASAAGVSRQHLAVRRLPGQTKFVVSDLGSSNGTYVNGQRVQGEQPLQSGDRIQLGLNGPQFEFVDPTAPRSAPATIVDAQQPAAPQTVIGQGAMGQGAMGASHPANYGLPPAQPYPSLDQPSQKSNKWGEPLKWGAGVVVALIALKFLFGVGNPSRESASAPPRSAPATPAAPAPAQTTAPETPVQPATTPRNSPAAASEIKVAGILACRETQGGCTTDTTSFNSSDPIDITTRFESKVAAGTEFSPVLQYIPPQGEPGKVEAPPKTFPEAINSFTVSLKRPKNGWPSGQYNFLLTVSNGSGSVVSKKSFSVR